MYSKFSVFFSYLPYGFFIRYFRSRKSPSIIIIYWIVSAFLLLVISIFPQIAIFASSLMGIESPANFVFLFMIFVILIKLFNLAIDISIQKDRLNRLVQKLALLHDRNGLDIKEEDQENK